MIRALQQNWKIYSMEAICLGLFMISASFFGTILESPTSTLHTLLPDSFLRLCIMGLAMGITAIGIFYSPMGKLSGAHMNPAVTFIFYWLGKIRRHDAIYYTIFQCAGGVLAVYGMTLLLGDSFRNAPVNYVITAPTMGEVKAFSVEVIIAFVMMMVVLITTNHSRLSSYTSVLAGLLVMVYVIVSGPVSGFSMNPARTIASAIPANQFPAFWIYMVAPFVGMFSAAILYRLFDGNVKCAKFHHVHSYRCIFHCGYCKHSPDDENRQQSSL